MLRRVLVLCGLLLSLHGCADPLGELTATPILKAGDTVPPNTAVVLVGMPSSFVSKMTFHWDTLGYINVMPPAQLNLIVAIPVNIPKNRFSLTTYSIGPYGSTPYGGSFGYIGVRTPGITLDKPGLYYVGTLDPSRPEHYSAAPIPAQLAELRERLGSTFGNLQPVNFTWP